MTGYCWLGKFKQWFELTDAQAARPKQLNYLQPFLVGYGFKDLGQLAQVHSSQLLFSCSERSFCRQTASPLSYVNI
jgi:hypothetical protein